MTGKTHNIQLTSGIVLAYRQIPQAQVEYFGVRVHVGSRNDPASAHGLAHFVEHTIFKGTERRSSWHIINRMERVGGELNAYTTKEETVVYTAAPRGNLSRSAELIADLIVNSQFPANELDKEREVVADEINSYLDTPAEAVFDEFEDIIFAGTGLGHNILGTIDALESFDSQACIDYLRRWYTKRNLVIFYCGHASADRVAAVCDRYFDCLPTSGEYHHENEIFNAPRFNQTRDLGLHQSHTVMGTLVGGINSPEKYAVSLATNILGGPGMNSRLNVALREKRGLVYSVDATCSLLSDCGLFTVYFGCDPEDNELCRRLVARELQRLADEPLSASAIAAAKKQYIGQQTLAMDNRENLALATGRAALLGLKSPGDPAILDAISAVTPADIQSAAAKLVECSILTLR